MTFSKLYGKMEMNLYCRKARSDMYVLKNVTLESIKAERAGFEHFAKPLSRVLKNAVFPSESTQT